MSFQSTLADRRMARPRGTTMDWEAIFAGIGLAATFATPIGLAILWVGRTYIDKWLTRRFQGQLDNLKHVQAQEIERLRAKIAGMLDRAAKLHQHEFEVLPLVWDKLTTLMGSSVAVVSLIQNYAGVGRMSREELDIVLSQTSFAEHEKEELRALEGRPRETLYMRLCDRDRLRVAFKDRADFHNTIIQRGIFVEPPLRAKLMELSLLIADALYNQAEFNDPDNDRPQARARSENADKVRVAGKAIVDDIETMISDRLWNASKLDA